jgi:hypothetical protein
MLSDLTHIPRVMRGLGWLNGARLLEIWFSRPRAVRPAYSVPETTTIRMDAWALTFRRARSVYDQLVRERIWANAAAQRRIAEVLRGKGLLGTTPRTFGNLGQPVPSQDPDYVNFRSIGSYWDLTADDMTAALGRFVFRILIAGSVCPARTGPRQGPAADAAASRDAGAASLQPNAFQVTINEVGVYIRDSFDFEENQYLGCWSDNPDGFSPIMPPSVDDTGLGPPPLFSPVGNRDFREWRARTGRGGDFLVFSDLKRIALNPPDTFVVR